MEIHEQERISPSGIFTTPAGETVVDFGQELTGYVELSVDAKCGDVIALSHAEVMDRDGNFYTENYRAAKAKLHYTCCDGRRDLASAFYLLDSVISGSMHFRVERHLQSRENFTAIVVHFGNETHRTPALL
ncbi:MAG: family 78 glycoside hydrolase catalytic domain [Lachnospiraceae bacterium]